MAIAPIDSNSADSEPGRKRKSRRRQTAHLKQVPQSKQLRETIRAACVQVAAALDKSCPLSKDEMEIVVRDLLAKLEQPDSYVGWTMVMLASEFWRDQVAAVPHERRLFLLPHCLKHAEGCPADYDQFGLDCKTCGACSIADYRTIAEEMGYKVLVAEGSPIVMKIIVSGHVDAIVGVACLNVLEKAIDKILMAGIPCMAVPLLSSDCRNTSVDEDWVHDMIQIPHQQPQQKTRSYVHLMRAASSLFEQQELTRLVQPQRKGPTLAEVNGHGAAALDPISATEKLALDFLARGGKYSRPFTTLAVYDALTGGEGTTGNGAERVAQYSDSVKRTALAIETFHKASLVHDDIEDDDAYRYGDVTVHRKYGVPTAINLGDYMIGLGYRLVSRDRKELGGDKAAQILDCLADCHMRLSEGQGAELLWRDASDKSLKPVDALKIYALKTSPAFEAALQCGAILSDAEEDYSEPMRFFARHVGVAFQILNDLKDWRGDSDNKMSAGGDVLGGRPTVLWALALENLNEANRTELMELISDDSQNASSRVARVRELYNKAGVFAAAQRLVEKYRARAEEIADKLEPEELRRLMYYLADAILDDPAATQPPNAVHSLTTDLVVAPA
ncbi:polyprenyl synthetase family protein [Blastopirellula retiformator]|uniref:All-trans-nonaprenyl-diphosphate synthase (Geranyl-diphosphate specific) n=1 Tax=Blastopirellula retiformator TaxID=2527970 RepID=A0A5C5VNN9_9BACT|nr:polyprenyl synthetase family protein [Blastopirellula retiformator]TWT39563.1 All-trans-nonaprenyl-diphosphate synthase (geranyl-diphosphate specific) [Blastopirellula retiformator]